MPTISIKVRRFPSALGINDTHECCISKRRCLKFAASVGLPMLMAGSPSTSHAMSLASYKALALKCTLDFTGDHFRRPAECANLDPTEKANLSYWTGMTFAGIFADELLDVSRLLHASGFQKNRLIRTRPESRSLADLLGQDPSGAWHVIEAKARQADPSSKTCSKWKQQTETISTIDRVVPQSCSYSVIKVAGEHSMEVVDPPSPTAPQKGVAVELLKGAVSKGYYGPWREWLRNGSRVISRNENPIVAKLAGYDSVDAEYVFFGCHQGTLELSENSDKLPAELEPLDTEDMYMGSDGITVITTKRPEIG